MAAITLEGVHKSYGNVPVVHGVDIEIADGEFVVLVGPSGCGKSTLLRMVAGLETITDGTLRIDGRVVNDLAPKDRDIAMVFQSYALYPHMSVAQNMGFSLKLRGVAADEIDRQVRRAAQILALESYLDRRPRELSGGQRQRVAMGRAIVRNPQVFLFDEPLSNLDAKLRVQMRAEIKALHQQLRITTVYVTHDQTEAMTMADRIVVMQGGHVEQSGAPLDLYDRPANVFVAGFLGSPAMNFIRGTLVAGERPGLRLDDGSMVEVRAFPASLAGNNIIFGIRPEDIEIVPDGGLAATVGIVEPTGAETHVMARAGGQDVTLVRNDRVAITPGQQIGLQFLAPRSHFFDAESARRLNI
ncbi:sn-glycerol-3-phosphate ABC transporter ATP-binding protein UgpC [Devosia sp.]|uniref:ABC transporter ATP-binding protein n=1 Tax=Devosia sp. TaxID=1871048 RepID=UPI0019EFE729|nr:sn-glycerol-3-phosphate ABC transporter ATP-binding protein UgpC [Devosia sp.]MBE0581866.1 sn-glycerol-3-phosphate ABC transporter ATP-binding protein UgpC [Devosia sp.]